MEIETLKVTVTYTVELGKAEMTEVVKNRLMKASKENEELNPNRIQDGETGDWIFDNINEKDAMDWECEITEIS
jgi:hypothetical protein